MPRIPDVLRISVAAGLAAVAALVGAWVAIAQQQRPIVDAKALVNAASNTEEWITYGRDYAETHFSPLDQINDQNVSRLKLAWSWATEAPQGQTGVEATPLMHNGTLYGSLTWGVLWAVDARKWRWDPGIPRERIARICCGPVNRGVALYNGKVYAGLVDGRVVALDEETGKLVWEAKATDPEKDTIMTAAARVVKGKVIVGTAGAEQAARGYFTAYDAETGAFAWRFYTVPGDPSKPFEHPELEMAAKTWNGEWYKYGGGGTVWDGMAYDPELDLLYVGTGNGGPWNQNYRSPGGGDNLFLASILAVKPDTGRMVWYYQTVPGEHWDFTATQPLILADIEIDGRLRKVIMQAPKNGFFYVLDRVTGEFIGAKPFARRITWAKGIDKNGRPIEAKGARYTTEPVTVWPGAGGAHSWRPMSYSPLTKLVYIPGNESSWTYTPDPEFIYQPGYWNSGLAQGQRPPRPDGRPAPTPPKPAKIAEPEGAELQPQASGPFLVAMDPVTQTERWRVTSQQVPGLGVSGTLATAGNLVFSGQFAFNAATGKKLWEEPQLGGSAASWMTYMLDGKQYVAILARAIPNNTLFVFTLDGAGTMPPLPQGQGKGGFGGAPKGGAPTKGN
jgi:PQQ-dependent dehydrogenase (methanol/ethanol family)